jgi:hypothetical protein
MLGKAFTGNPEIWAALPRGAPYGLAKSSPGLVEVKGNHKSPSKKPGSINVYQLHP